MRCQKQCMAWLYRVTFSGFKAFKTDLRVMAKSSNSVNQTYHRTALRLLYHLHHITSALKLLWLCSKG